MSNDYVIKMQYKCTACIFTASSWVCGKEGSSAKTGYTTL